MSPKDANWNKDAIPAETFQQDDGLSFLNQNEETDDTEVEDNTKDKQIYSGFFDRYRRDGLYRRKLIQTVWICWSFTMLGLHFCQMGPALPDLRLIIQKDLETASWLFVSRTVGYVVGAFVSGYLYDRYNRLLLFSLALAFMGGTNGAVPWFESFHLMIAVIAFHGFFMSAVDTGGFTVVVSIWGAEGRSYVQALTLMFGVGGSLSPLLTELFLAEQRPENVSQNFNSSALNYSTNHEENQRDHVTTQSQL
ncbi:hypothetical protein CHS0354_012186 [Potamilus streckersoni]|uniref:Uncharacterized protein n=1 Tax=Potamilus streckersoni TaxID=2493646 RepID=A0AAE0SA83_9BIVA|nr:hypothetical protein CHS0354_012186 [Potamilus streckersoni]